MPKQRTTIFQAYSMDTSTPYARIFLTANPLGLRAYTKSHVANLGFRASTRSQRGVSPEQITGKYSQTDCICESAYINAK